MEQRANISHLALWEEFVAVTSEKAVTVWNWHTSEEIFTVEDADTYVDVILLEDVIVLVTQTNAIHVWDWWAGRAMYTIENSDSTIINVYLREDWAFYLLEDQSLTIANWRTKQAICRIPEFRGQVLDVVKSDKLLTVFDNQLCLWSLKTAG